MKNIFLSASLILSSVVGVQAANVITNDNSETNQQFCEKNALLQKLEKIQTVKCASHKPGALFISDVDGRAYLVVEDGDAEGKGIRNNKILEALKKGESLGRIEVTTSAFIYAYNVCTTHVTDMSSLFDKAWSFNRDIGTWDTSNVTDMNSMFRRAGDFNQDIGAWDVSNVKNMRSMFYGAFVFNQDISHWNTSSVVNMSYMFGNIYFFNQDISCWDTSNVEDMSSMFEGTYPFKQNLSGWDVSKVTKYNDFADLLNRSFLPHFKKVT